jgi:hypothetical protein
MTIPAEAKFSTADRLNTPEPEPTQEEVLAEALRIVRGETMMLATKKHLVALAGLNEKLTTTLEGLGDFFEIVMDHGHLSGGQMHAKYGMDPMRGYEFVESHCRAAQRKVKAALRKTEVPSHA